MSSACFEPRGLDGFSGLWYPSLRIQTRPKSSDFSGIWKILRMPSEGKWKNLSHVPALWHVKEPSTSVNYEYASKIPCIVPSFATRGFSCLCGVWRLWRWMRGTHWGQGYSRPTGCSAERPHMQPLTLTFNLMVSFSGQLETCIKCQKLKTWIKALIWKVRISLVYVA